MQDIRQEGKPLATYHLRIPDLACSGCVDSVTAAIQGLDSTAQITADLKTKAVTIQTQAPEPQIRVAIVQAGYTPE